MTPNLRSKEVVDIHFLTVSEVARHAGVSSATVYGWINRQEIPFCELPGRSSGKYRFVRIRKSDFDEFIEKHSTKPQVSKPQTLTNNKLHLLPRKKNVENERRFL